MNQYDSRKARLAKIEEMLQVRPMTKAEVAAITGYSRGSVWKCFDDLIFRRRIYVAGWHWSGKGDIERFAFGDLPDVPKPQCHVLDEDDEVAFKRPRVKVVVRRDPLVAALFGMAA